MKRFKGYKIAVAICSLIVTVLAFQWIVRQHEGVSLKDRWANIHVGMSKEEVRCVLGSPDNIYPVGSVQSNSLVGTVFLNFMFDRFLEKWAYGNRSMIDFQYQFPYLCPAWDGFMEPEANDYVIYFSNDGKVVKKKYPYRAKESSE